jgi:hypothetical protein
MFLYKEKDNVCQAQDVLDAILLIRWLGDHSGKVIPVTGRDKDIYWFREGTEITIMLKHGDTVKAVLNIVDDYDNYVTRLTSAIFNGKVNQPQMN